MMLRIRCHLSWWYCSHLNIRQSIWPIVASWDSTAFEVQFDLKNQICGKMFLFFISYILILKCQDLALKVIYSSSNIKSCHVKLVQESCCKDLKFLRKYPWNYSLSIAIKVSTKGCISYCRSSGPEVFCKKGVLRNFTKFTGKHLCQSLFFNKVVGADRTRLGDCFFMMNHWDMQNLCKYLIQYLYIIYSREKQSLCKADSHIWDIFSHMKVL